MPGTARTRTGEIHDNFEQFRRDGIKSSERVHRLTLEITKSRQQSRFSLESREVQDASPGLGLPTTKLTSKRTAVEFHDMPWGPSLQIASS